MNRATVVVNVVRNAHNPIFFERSYSVTIDQDIKTEVVVENVTARDLDKDVSCFNCSCGVVHAGLINKHLNTDFYQDKEGVYNSTIIVMTITLGTPGHII